MVSVVCVCVLVSNEVHGCGKKSSSEKPTSQQFKATIKIVCGKEMKVDAYIFVLKSNETNSFQHNNITISSEKD
jgi:hypothetical protein